MYVMTPNQKASLNKAINAHNNSDLKSAELIYRKLISERVKEPFIYTQLAIICATSKRHNEAKQLCEFVLNFAPTFINALILLADLYKNVRDFPTAIEFYKKTIKEDPNFYQAYLSLSFSLVQIGKLDEGEKYCRKVISLKPDFIQAQDYLGQILMFKGDLAQAKSIFNQLVSKDPNNVPALYTLGNILKSQGEFEEAALTYKKVMTLRPDYSQAHFTYASIHKYLDKTDLHITLMLQQYQSRNIPVESKIQLSFALAKAFEDLEDYSQSFKYLSEGNNLKFERYNYSIEPDKLFIESIIKSFNQHDIANLNIKSQASCKPIFIVGMPRSGTSLVEKIIATHTKVYAAGELDYMFRLGTSLFLDETTEFLFKQLSEYDKNKFDAIAKTYLKQIELLSNSHDRITDKLPFNMLLIGLIKIVFPNAKIIHCVRDAKDNCFSIFKQNFTTDNYRFAYNLKTLGQYHKLYQQLMKHWHQTFPDTIYDVCYETLVSNPDKEIRKLIETCDLEWQEECLNFDKSKGVVKTASAYQVRQPIYTSSVNLWEKYQKFLSPLINELTN